MARRSFVFVYLIVITAFVCLVPKEMDGLIFYARDVLFRFDVLQTICFIPTCREDIE